MSFSESSSNPHADLARGYLICFIATAVWSTTAIFIRYLTETYDLPPLVLAFWRDAIVFITMVAFFALFNRARLTAGKQHILFLIFYGFVLSMINALWTVSVAINGAAVSTVLVYSSPAITAILGWWLFSEPLDVVKLCAVFLSVFGCVLISGAYDLDVWGVNPLGIVTGLLSGLAFAGYSLMGRASSRRSINPWTGMLYSFGFAAVFILLYNFFLLGFPIGVSSSNLFWLDTAWIGWFVLFLLAAGPTIGGYGLYTVSLTYLPASVANLIATLEPVLTALLAFFILGERFSSIQLVGGTLIICGVLLLRFSTGRVTFEEKAA